MRTVALLSFLMLTAMLAGCTGSSTVVDDGRERPSLTLLDASVNMVNGTCGVGPESCHILRVQVSNTPGTDFPTTAIHWTASATDGGVYAAHSMVGPIAIAPNATMEVSILFVLASNLTIDVLRWDDVDVERISLSIPEYLHHGTSSLLTQCLDDHSDLVAHYHPILTVLVNGTQVPINSNIGIGTTYCPGGQMHIVHVHDSTQGEPTKLHVEHGSEIDGVITLGLFFDIWGFNFSAEQLETIWLTKTMSYLSKWMEQE